MAKATSAPTSNVIASDSHRRASARAASTPRRMPAQMGSRPPEVGGRRRIVAIATDLRLQRRRSKDVVGDGINLFVAGAIASCGSIVHTPDEAIAALRAHAG